MRDVFIYEAIRTPRGRGKAGKGALSGVHPQELLAQTLNRMADKAGLERLNRPGHTGGTNQADESESHDGES